MPQPLQGNDKGSDTHSGTIHNFKIYSNMVTMKFSAIKSDTLFLTPTIAIEQTNSESTIHFAVAHKVFSITVEKQQITKKVKA